LEMAHLGHWEYDVTKDLFTFNDQFYKIFRTTAKQVGGYTMSSAEYARRFLHPDDLHVVRDEIWKSIETTDPDFSQQLEHRILYADGEIGHIAVRIFPVKDHLGRTIRTYGVNQDVTERVRMQEALKESEEWYRTLVEESFDGIFVYTGPEIIFANRRFHEMLGHTQGELEGKDHLLLCHPDYRKLVRERASARLRGEGVLSKYKISLLRKDGSPLDVEINAKAMSIKGEPGVQVWVRDISKEISLQRQLLQAQKMEAIGTLAGGVAHDFNNMLTIILGYAEILLSDMDEQDPRSEDLDKIVQTAKNGADLVKRLLTFSRKADIEFRPLELNVEIERTQKLWERTLSKMIDIRLNLEDNLAPVNADPVQIDQILMNLAINARDAMPDGGHLAIETKNVTLDERYCDSHVNVRPGKYVMLSISDTGHGMDEPTRARIFDPFLPPRNGMQQRERDWGLPWFTASWINTVAT
jgi:two-component system, cell cycle sensor histidine kinase and response regulator CckA